MRPVIVLAALLLLLLLLLVWKGGALEPAEGFVSAEAKRAAQVANQLFAESPDVSYTRFREAFTRDGLSADPVLYSDLRREARSGPIRGETVQASL